MPCVPDSVRVSSFTGRTSTVARAVAVFAATFALCAFSIARNRQMGLCDQWFAMGVNLAATGVLGDGSQPSVFKPPGYPAFVAGVTGLAVGPPVPFHEPHRFPRHHELAGLVAPYDPGYLERAARAVYWAQALILAASAVLLMLWIDGLCRKELSFAAAILFGTNPYSIVLVGLLHYGVLHMFLLIAAGCAIDCAARSGRAGALVGSGLLWGAATLVRPVTLLLPPFLLGALLWRSFPNHRMAVRNTALVLLGMAAVLIPYTARNYRVAGTFVPVSAQTWTNIWASSASVVEPQPNYYRWKAMREPLRRILRRTFPESAGQAQLSPDTLSLPQNLHLEAEMKTVALKNLRYRPEAYLENCARSFWSFNTDISAVLIKVYQYVQRPGFRPKAWYWPGEDQDFHSSSDMIAFARLVDVLTLLSFAGVAWAVVARDSSLALSGGAYLCLAVAHSITWLDLWYYYAKLPFLCVFAFCCIERVQRWSESRQYRWPVSRLLAGGLMAWGLVLSARVVGGS